jgi:hypothetical protein
MKKIITSLLLIFIFLGAHAPMWEPVPPWKLASFTIEGMSVITKNGNYHYDKLPNLFLVYERKWIFGYEILLSKFESKTKKWY